MINPYVRSDSPIVGHASQLSQLAHDLESGNLAHAYLFIGPTHIGKFTVAKWFAKELMGQGDVDLLLHPDVLILDQLWMEETNDDLDALAKSSNVPQQHRAKAKVKTDVIGIEDVRVIQEKLYETGVSPYRICMIRNASRMKDEAANAFLKTLEEPPPKRVFILTAPSLNDVLPTISSRSRVVTFQRVGSKHVQPLLKDLDPDDASFILHAAQGAPGTAIRLRDDPDALRIEKQLHSQAHAVWTARSLADRLRSLKPLLDRGNEADEFLRHLALSLREVPTMSRPQERALQQLVEDLETNAHRGLMVQRFAMGI